MCVVNAKLSSTTRVTYSYQVGKHCATTCRSRGGRGQRSEQSVVQRILPQKPLCPATGRETKHFRTKSRLTGGTVNWVKISVAFSNLFLIKITPTT